MRLEIKDKDMKKLYIRYKKMKEANKDTTSTIGIVNPLGNVNPMLAEQLQLVTNFNEWQEHDDNLAGDLFDAVTGW